jgi:DNA-binding Lrp family transcriptional regulator
VVAELEANVVKIKHALDNQKTDAAKTSEWWKRQCEGLNVQIETAESRIMDQYLEDSDKLESKISSLESSVEAELKEVNMLSSRCTELRGLIDELTKLNAALTEENQQVEAKAQAISDILENEREVNDSLSMQIEIMEKELSSTRLRILEVSQQRDDTIASMEREMAKQASIINDEEARARLYDFNLEEMRSDMDSLRASTSREVEILQGTRKEWCAYMFDFTLTRVNPKDDIENSN